MGLASFYQGYESPDYSADVFCRFSYWDDKPTLESDQSDKIGDIDRDVTGRHIYSFDASKVFDSWNPLAGGAHSDIKDFHESPKNDEGRACTQNQTKIAKRKFSFKFVYRFTKTNFVGTVNRIEQEMHNELEK